MQSSVFVWRCNNEELYSYKIEWNTQKLVSWRSAFCSDKEELLAIKRMFIMR